LAKERMVRLKCDVLENMVGEFQKLVETNTSGTLYVNAK
jgi:hypothetical protein